MTEGVSVKLIRTLGVGGSGCGALGEEELVDQNMKVWEVGDSLVILCTGSALCCT